MIIPNGGVEKGGKEPPCDSSKEGHFPLMSLNAPPPRERNRKGGSLWNPKAERGCFPGMYSILIFASRMSLFQLQGGMKLLAIVVLGEEKLGCMWL